MKYEGTMRRFLIAICTISLAASMAATAAAEKTVPVNDPASPGVFDQPSAVARGNTVHVTYIGADNTAGPFRVFYAAVDLSLSRTTPGFLVTQPTAIDNTDAGNDAYADARHPRIAMLSSTEAEILFQAKPTSSPDPTFALYLARLTLDNNMVVNQSVRMVTGVSGFNEDVSFKLVTADKTARVAYAGRSATTGDFDVFYARISLDNAAVTGTPGTPLLLSSVAGSTGFRPLPSLILDSSDRAHVAWAANSASSTPNGVYYAMVDETNGADNVVIAATEVLGRSRKWGHPNVLVDDTSSIIIVAADEILPEVAGNIGMVNINPNADDRDGDPVEFSPYPPGGGHPPRRFQPLPARGVPRLHRDDPHNRIRKQRYKVHLLRLRDHQLVALCDIQEDPRPSGVRLVRVPRVPPRRGVHPGRLRVSDRRQGRRLLVRRGDGDGKPEP
jgi:hypothetical protein